MIIFLHYRLQSLMEKNQRSRMNCVIEKKRAEEVMDHQPKTVRLPFGVNITTDPRYEHVTGERMAIYCESGHDQRYPVFCTVFSETGTIYLQKSR